MKILKFLEIWNFLKILIFLKILKFLKILIFFCDFEFILKILKISKIMFFFNFWYFWNFWNFLKFWKFWKFQKLLSFFECIKYNIFKKHLKHIAPMLKYCSIRKYRKLIKHDFKLSKICNYTLKTMEIVPIIDFCY